MLYMVEVDVPYPERIAEWETWYEKHAVMLLSIPGILFVQRFRSVSSDISFTQLYSIRNAGVISSPAYQAKAGPGSTGEWRTLMTNWHRNILEGIDLVPEVASGGWLAVSDRLVEQAPALPSGYVGLKPVGLDRNVVERGLMFGDEKSVPPAVTQDGHVRTRVFRPASRRLSSSVEPA